MEKTTGERLAQLVPSDLNFDELSVDIEPIFPIEEIMVGWR